jgi:hypothetical protein
MLAITRSVRSHLYRMILGVFPGLHDCRCPLGLEAAPVDGMDPGRRSAWWVVVRSVLDLERVLNRQALLRHEKQNVDQVCS